MSISELIEQLEAFKEKHGNVEVIMWDEYGSRPVSEITMMGRPESISLVC